MEWQPHRPDGSLASVGSLGLWLCSADVHATDAPARLALSSAASLHLSFPRNWPAVFKQSAALASLLRKSALNGVRCRAVNRPTSDELASLAHLPRYPFHSFSNASRLAEECGWRVVKGFVVLERTEAPPGESFVAFRHWWNAREADGIWFDVTPPFTSEERYLLVESLHGDKAPSELTQGHLDFVTGLAKRLAAGGVPSLNPCVPGRAGEVEAASAIGALKAKQTLDYSKWESVDVSDEDEPQIPQASEMGSKRPTPLEGKEKEALQKARQQAAENDTVKAQSDHINAAIDAMASAAVAGDSEVLEGLQAACRDAAPLDARMESILSTLPQAAQLAARASALLSAASDDPVGGRAEKEPTLKELLTAQNTVVDVEDPGLEDPREFFESAEAAAAAEGRLAEEQQAANRVDQGT